MSETWGHVECLTCSVHKIVDNNSHHVGETLASIFSVPRRSNPSITTKVLECSSKLVRTDNLSTLKFHPPFFTDFL